MANHKTTVQRASLALARAALTEKPEKIAAARHLLEVARMERGIYSAIAEAPVDMSENEIRRAVAALEIGLRASSAARARLGREHA